jgi:signal transduction histidine kinase
LADERGTRPSGGERGTRWWDLRPLDRIASVRMKFAIVIVLAVAVSALVSQIGLHFGIPILVRPVIAVIISLLFVRFAAHGLTAPLREMERATSKMARGDYSQRVRDTGHDEVGRLATSFNAMAAELETVERQRKDLIANVSHELRTPLSALQARLENLADGIEPADPDVLRAMLAQTERLGRLVSQLLDLSRLESGSMPLHLERFAVEELLEQAADESRWHRPDVEVRVHVEPPSLELDGDIERLHQVVANLLENAARHSGPDSPIDLRGRSVGRSVVVEIADRGPGIPESDRARIFERFYRADASRVADGAGAGLGLSIARWIVDLHHGSIRAEPRQPSGCRMVIELPGEEATAEMPAIVIT